mmetsp:Transcript_35133/g.71622  ORF Transcript_35133/g.71622 Transcript_35133/m.71622 type:complete len:82 (-) Transcript_35133:434-679(-)
MNVRPLSQIIPLPRIRSLVQQQLSEGGVSSLAREVQRGVTIGILDVDFGASLEESAHGFNATHFCTDMKRQHRMVGRETIL